MTFKFLHSSDLHIGRKFANIPQPPDGNVRGRLMEARHGAIATLAAAAQAQGAGHVLLAGDTFDTATPSTALVRQALSAMGDAADITWWLLPGNHDNLRDAEPLWDMIRDDGPANVHGVTLAAPVLMAPGATLLPCPIAFRAVGMDPTEALMTMPSDQGTFRIGLAHGGITDFTESGEVIAADRDRSARLDYLALGDWHGRMAVSPRVHYPGSPEQDRFKHGRRGVCLAVTLPAPGAAPIVEDIELGQFLWIEVPLTLHPHQDAAAALEAVVPATGRRDTLVRVVASGWATLADRQALDRAADALSPEFAHFDLRTQGLGTQYDVADLDDIDRSGGALRMAAEALLSDTRSESLAAEDRAAAADALARLYAYVREGSR